MTTNGDDVAGSTEDAVGDDAPDKANSPSSEEEMCATRSVASGSIVKSGTTSPREFPFFRERREPFFWLNNAFFLISFGLFIYFTITIVWDFIKQRNDPPTATNLNNGIQQDFPGMAFCTHMASEYDQPNIVPVYADFYDGENNKNISSQLKELKCPSDSVLGGQQESCWYLDSQLAAFQSTSPTTCTHRNTITLAFSLDPLEYSPDVLLTGLDGYLFLPGKSTKVVDAFCNNYFPSSCQSLVPPDDSCNANQTDLSLDGFFATNKLANLIDLERSETQTSPRCDQDLVQWDPTVTVSAFNEKFFRKRNISIDLAETAVLMHFQFTNTHVIKSTYNPQSPQAMFGSLSGWFGFLSDGWGIISLVFIFEQLINYLRARTGR